MTETWATPFTVWVKTPSELGPANVKRVPAFAVMTPLTGGPARTSIEDAIETIRASSLTIRIIFSVLVWLIFVAGFSRRFISPRRFRKVTGLPGGVTFAPVSCDLLMYANDGSVLSVRCGNRDGCGTRNVQTAAVEGAGLLEPLESSAAKAERVVSVPTAATTSRER